MSPPRSGSRWSTSIRFTEVPATHQPTSPGQPAPDRGAGAPVGGGPGREDRTPRDRRSTRCAVTGRPCFVKDGGGGWLLLTERPGLRRWEEVDEAAS